MGRWTQYDEDSYRLPAGMKRVGYDADTGRYLFRSYDNNLWAGPEGSQYGEMRPVWDAPAIVSNSSTGEDIEAAPSRADGYEPVVSQESTSKRTRVRIARLFRPFFSMLSSSSSSSLSARLPQSPRRK